MAEMENILAEMEALRHEINTLREFHANANEASRTNLQKIHIPKFNTIRICGLQKLRDHLLCVPSHRTLTNLILSLYVWKMKYFYPLRT